MMLRFAVRWGNTPMNLANDMEPRDKIIIDRLLQTPLTPQQLDIHIAYCCA